MKTLLLHLLTVMFALNISSTPALAIAPRPVAFSYDALDRLLQVNYDDGQQINYTYDDMGNITSVKTRGTSPPVVIVNGEPTPYDDDADVVLHRSISEVLPQIVG